MAPILTSRSLLGLLLVSLMACLCAGATAVAETPSAIFDETRLSLHADTLTDEQLLAGFALIKDFLPSGLDPLDVVYAIKNGTELALTSAQVQEVEVARQVTRRAQGTRGVDLTPCQVATASVLVDAVGVLASLWGVSMRLDPSDLSTIQLTYQELESFKGLVDIVGSKSSSLYQKLKSTVALIKGALNMFGIKQIVKWMTSGLSAWQAVKMAVTMSAQILVWFGTDGAALLGELLALGVGLETLVEDAVACKAACASIAPLPLPPAMRLAVIQNAVEDWTSLEVFLIDQTSVPLHRYQNTDLSWSDWLNLAEPIPMTRLSVARNADGRLEAFGLGSNGEAYHTRQDPNGPGGWNGWGSFGGWSSEIAVGANADGRLELVAAGSKNRAYHLWEDSPSSTSWSGWSTLSGEHPMKEFSVTIRPDGFMQVFALDTNQALYYVRQGPNGDGGWESWQSLGGWSSSMVSSTNLDGRLEVFAVGSDNNVFHIWENAPNSNSWSQWSTFFTFKAKQLTATNLADGNIIVFALGMDQAIYYIYEGSNGWTSWTSLGGSASTISSITTADGIVQVYALFSGDKDVNVLQQLNAIDPTGWSDWAPLN